MARIQQSIDVDVPVHIAYRQLMQFDDYPRFMQEVETVRKVDDYHLHWTARMSYQTLEWDAEITEQRPDQCIAWRNSGGPISAGKVEMEPAGEGRTCVTMTMDCDPLQIIPAQDGGADTAVAQQLEQDLLRFKALMESSENELRAQHPTAENEVAVAHTSDDSELASPGRQHAGVNAPIPVARDNVPLKRPEAGDDSLQAASSAPATPSTDTQAGRSVQPDNSLSGMPDTTNDGEALTIAEDQGFDQQSAQARRVGQMPQDAGAVMTTEDTPSEAMAQSMQQDDKKDNGELKQSVDRIVPPAP